MSHILYFYEQKIIPTRICKNFDHQEINSSIKALLETHDLDGESKLRKKLFKEIEINYLSISALNKSIESFLKKDDIFISKSTFFMIEAEMLEAIKNIIMEDQSKSDQTKDAISILDSFFNKKLLFATIY